jgi:hypothetical protein
MNNPASYVASFAIGHSQSAIPPPVTLRQAGPPRQRRASRQYVLYFSGSTLFRCGFERLMAE